MELVVPAVPPIPHLTPLDLVLDGATSRKHTRMVLRKIQGVIVIDSIQDIESDYGKNHERAAHKARVSTDGCFCLNVPRTLLPSESGVGD